MTEWFENSMFWEKLYPFMFRDDGFLTAEQDLDQLLTLVPEPGHHILDLCCGPGRISIPLAKRGFQVTGVDITGFLINKAKQRALDNGVSVEWVQEDMRQFIRPESYDLILNLYTSFGYFENPDEDLRVLQNVKKNLKPGGTIIMELVGKEIMARSFQSAQISRIDDTMLIQSHEILDGWTRIRNNWILITDQEVNQFPFEHALYSAKELKDLCSHAGLTEIMIFGGFDRSPYDHRARRLVLVGKKAGINSRS